MSPAHAPEEVSPAQAPRQAPPTSRGSSRPRGPRQESPPTAHAMGGGGMPPRAPLAARHTGARMCPSAWPAPPGRDRAPAPSFSSLRLRAGPTHPPVRLPERHRVSPLGRRCPQAHTCGATPRCRRRRHGGTRARARQGRLQVRGVRGDRGAMRGFRAGVALRGDLQPPEATAISDERVRLNNGTRLLKGTHESHISHPCPPSRAGDSGLGAVVCGATPSGATPSPPLTG